jgi:hypothetical protein
MSRGGGRERGKAVATLRKRDIVCASSGDSDHLETAFERMQGIMI